MALPPTSFVVRTPGAEARRLISPFLLPGIVSSCSRVSCVVAAVVTVSTIGLVADDRDRFGKRADLQCRVQPRDKPHGQATPLERLRLEP